MIFVTCCALNNGRTHNWLPATPTIVLEPLLIVFGSAPINNCGELSPCTSFKIYLHSPYTPVPLKRMTEELNVWQVRITCYTFVNFTEFERVFQSGRGNQSGERRNMKYVLSLRSRDESFMCSRCCNRCWNYKRKTKSYPTLHLKINGYWGKSNFVTVIYKK